MYKSHYIRGDEAMKLNYKKKTANNSTKMKTIAKKQYYENELEKSKGNPQKTWEIIRTLLTGKSHCSNFLPSNFTTLPFNCFPIFYHFII